MSRNLEKDAVEMADKNRRILEKGFAIFAEKGIENVKMTDVAKAAGIGIASLYRYYSTKPELVLAIGTWAWKEYFTEQIRKAEDVFYQTKSASERIAYYLDSFLDLYRNKKDLLRFNQFFNIYLLNAKIPEDKRSPYNNVIGILEERFVRFFRQGQEEGTLRNDLSGGEVFSTMTHLMLAVVTRYAVGLVFINKETDEEKEIQVQKDMMLRWICTAEKE
jgi:AcrR family transcriptional regulator